MPPKKGRKITFELTIKDPNIHWVTVDQDGSITGFEEEPIKCPWAPGWDVRGRIEDKYWVRLGNIDPSEIQKFDWRNAKRFIG